MKIVRFTYEDGYKKVKDIKPTFKNIELVFYNSDQKNFLFDDSPDTIKFDKVLEQYGDKQVLGIVDYYDTYTTSITINTGTKKVMRL